MLARKRVNIGLFITSFLVVALGTAADPRGPIGTSRPSTAPGTSGLARRSQSTLTETRTSPTSTARTFTSSTPNAWAAPGRRKSSRAPSSYPYPSLALDSQGRPHIAYSGNGLYYTHWTGAEWQSTYVSGQPAALRIPSLALTATDEPCIAAYMHTDNGDSLWYAAPDGPSRAAFRASAPILVCI